MPEFIARSSANTDSSRSVSPLQFIIPLKRKKSVYEQFWTAVATQRGFDNG
jgi:hypothetical protein